MAMLMKPKGVWWLACLGEEVEEGSTLMTLMVMMAMVMVMVRNS